MRLLTISNLYPRPDRPQEGLFNLNLFSRFDRALGSSGGSVRNICLVPEFRLWRWPAVRRWRLPASGGPATHYQPVFYAPVVGRSLGHRFYAASLRASGHVPGDADRVYVSWLYPDFAAVARCLGRQPVRLWGMALGSDAFHLASRVRRRAVLSACRRADGVVCVTRELRERLVGAGVDAARVRVAPNGVDGSRFRHRPKDEALRQLRALCPGCDGGLFDALEGQTRSVLFVGHLCPVKGPDLLLRAWAKVAADGVAGCTPPRLVVIGDGPLRAGLASDAARLGCEGSIVFLGALPQPWVALWMNAADVLCLPSRSEGMPNAVIEAVTSGLPVVASDVGAVGEILAGEPLARTVASGDEAGLARALRELLALPADRRAMAARFAGRYDWGRQAEEILGWMGE